MRRSSAFLAAFAASLAVVLVLSPLASFALSQSDADAARQRSADARRKQAAAQAKADKLVAETKALEDTVACTRGQLRGIEAKMAVVQARRSKLETEIAGLRSEIASRQSEIASTTAAYRQRSDTLGKRVASVYREGDLFYVELLLGSKSISDLLARSAFVTDVLRDDERIMSDLTDSRRDLEHDKLLLGRSAAALDAKLTAVAAEENALRGLQSDRASQLAEQRDAQAAKQGLLAETTRNIARLREAVAAEEAEAANIERTLRGGASHGKGRAAATFDWPCPGHTDITSPFGWRVHPILKTRKFHSGIDIGAPEGARIVAAGAGTVIFAGDRGGYGNCTMIDHGDGLVTVYAHQSSITVSEGDRVKRGEKIGEVGSTGLSTGPHLHFEVRVNGTACNPEDYL